MADTRVDTVQSLTGFPPAVKNVPPVWPTQPTPDKISLLWKYNNTDIYHRFSPYTDKEAFFGFLPNKQPFVWRYPDEENKSLFGNLPEKFKSFESRTLPIRAATDDLIRVAKWSVSPIGVLFYAKQLAIQLLNPFDETRIYNPLSPILSTVNPLGFGLIDRPTRHAEASVSGLINAAGGSTIAKSFGANLDTTPGSTVGSEALPSEGKATGKGLLRGHDAGLAYSSLSSKWPVGTGAGGKKGIMDMMKNAAQSLFLNTITGPGGPKSTYRADEGTYDLMISSNRLGLADNYRTSPAQMWYAFEDRDASTQTLSIQNVAKKALGTSFSIPSGGVTGKARSILGGALKKTDPTRGASPPRFKQKIIALPGITTLPFSANSGFEGKPIEGKQTGYTIVKGKEKYGQNVYPNPDGTFENSDMLVQYAEYIDKDNLFPSKFSDQNSKAVAEINDSLRKIIQNINLAGTVQIDIDTESRILSSGRMGPKPFLGYNTNELGQVPKPGAQKTDYGALRDYRAGRGIRSIDATFRDYRGTLKMAAAFKSDALNRIGVLGKNRKIDDSELMEQYPNYREWSPYDDDLIAFFFYDVVNEKYIPFRATVKGISEDNQAFWDELRFIGRADQLYNYSGFNRTLNFSFNIVVNSITELLPVWKKINYLASAVKPSNYTVSGQAYQKNFNRFMIPPMFMITIGDMYKFQPVVIRSVNVNIPDDAAWETLNESNSTHWSYLQSMITAYSTGLGKKYGQLPREAEIQVTCNLLEKERAIVGAGHYGHAPRADFYLIDEFNVNKDVPYLPEPTELHKRFVTYQSDTTNTKAANDSRIEADRRKLEQKKNDPSSVDFIGPKLPTGGMPTTMGDILANGKAAVAKIQGAANLISGPNQLGAKGQALLNAIKR